MTRQSQPCWCCAVLAVIVATLYGTLPLLAVEPIRPVQITGVHVALQRAGDKQPIRGVMVKGGDAEALTDFGGVAVFPALPQPPQRLRVEDLDYLWIDRALAPQELAAPVVVELTPLQVTAVNIRASAKGTGDALAGAHVVLKRLSPAFAPVLFDAYTGFGGTFDVTGVPAGQFEVDVTAQGCKPFHTVCQFDAGKAKLVAELEVEAGWASVAGSVVDAGTGRPVGGARVEAVHVSQGPLSEAALAATQSGADGTFLLDRVPRSLRRVMATTAPAHAVCGRFVLRVRAPGYLESFVPVELDTRTATTSGLRVALVPDAGPVAERLPNDAPERAQPIPPTCALNVQLKPGNAGHYFQITLPVDGLLRIGVPPRAIGLWLRMLERQRGTLLVESGFAAADKVATWPVALRAGGYVLCVGPWGNEQGLPGPLGFAIEFQPVVDPHERNDQPATAAEVAIAERFHGFLFPGDDHDYFRFKTASAGVGRFQTSAMPFGRWNRVLNDAGKLIVEAGAGDNGVNSMDFSIGAAGSYYAHTGGWGGIPNSLVPYVGAVEFVPCDAHDQPVRNETIASATPIPPNGFACGTLNPVDDVDVYRLTVLESGTLRARLSAIPIGRWMRILDGAGTLISECGAGNNQPADLVAPIRKRGTYYVQVSSWGTGLWSECPYLLCTAFYPNDRRDRRDNGTPRTASAISSATHVTGNIGFDGDVDHYRVFVPRRAVLHSHMGTMSLGRWMRTLDPAGAMVAERGFGGNEGGGLDTHVQRPGWQTLAVSAWGGGWTREPYRLWHDIDLEDPNEPNDDPSHATPLPARTALSGSILPVGDVDFYTFYVDRKDRYRLTCTAIDLGRWVRILDGSGKLITEVGGGANQPAVAEWDAPAPGAVLMQVSAWGDGASAQHYSIFAGRASEQAPPVARLSYKQDPTDRHKVTLVPSAAGSPAVVSYEIDATGQGSFSPRSGAPAPTEYTYPNSGWVTARLRVSDGAGGVGYDFATFNTRDPREDEAAVQAEFVRPAADASVDALLEVEALAWRADGGPIGELQLLADGQPVARWLTEPFVAEVDPSPWAGKAVELTLIAPRAAPAAGAAAPVLARTSLRVPPLLRLLPADGSLLTSARVTFTWDTGDDAPSQVTVTKPDGSSVTFDGANARHHRVEAQGLEQDREYTWVARSGDRSSAPRRFRLVRGIEFAERTYKFEIARDYDQRGSIRVVNHAETPARLKLHVGSQQEDLLVSFVGEGSPDKVIELGPGEQRDLLLVFSAQDALQERFAFPITLEGKPSSGSEAHADVAQVEVKVRMPRVDYEAKVLGQDAGTLAYDVEVENRGEKLTDFTAHLDGPAATRAFLSPTIRHATLDAGGRLRFKVVPVLSEKFEPFEVALVMRGIHIEKRTTHSFALPAGKKVFLATIDPVQETNAKADYCTNRPVVGAQLTVPNGPQIGTPVNTFLPTRTPSTTIPPIDPLDMADLDNFWPDDVVKELKKISIPGKPCEEARQRAALATRYINRRLRTFNRVYWGFIPSWSAVTYHAPGFDLTDHRASVDLLRGGPGASQGFGPDVANLAWSLRTGACAEHSTLMNYLLNQSGTTNTKIVESTAGHNFVLVCLADGADPDRPWTWGPSAFVADSWLQQNLSPQDAWHQGWMFGDGSARVYGVGGGKKLDEKVSTGRALYRHAIDSGPDWIKSHLNELRQKLPASYFESDGVTLKPNADQPPAGWLDGGR